MLILSTTSTGEKKNVSNLHEIYEHGDKNFQLEAAGIIAKSFPCLTVRQGRAAPVFWSISCLFLKRRWEKQE